MEKCNSNRSNYQLHDKQLVAPRRRCEMASNKNQN